MNISAISTPRIFSSITRIADSVNNNTIIVPTQRLARTLNDTLGADIRINQQTAVQSGDILIFTRDKYSQTETWNVSRKGLPLGDILLERNEAGNPAVIHGYKDCGPMGCPTGVELTSEEIKILSGLNKAK